MAQIPIVKLNNGSTNYYPFSVGEATVITHDIEVQHDIGNYKAGDVIPAVTTFDSLISNIFNGTGGGNSIDGITITRNPQGKLTVGVIQQNQIQGLGDTISGAVASAVSEAESMDEELHDTVDSETDAKVNALKFTVLDAVEMSNMVSVANVVKQILMKLGMPESNITIKTTTSRSSS